MIPAQSFWTHSLHGTPWGGSITRILAEAIRAADPGEAVHRSVDRKGEILKVAGLSYELASYDTIRLLGFGKASLGMARALSDILGSYLSDGLVITKRPQDLPQGAITVLQGGHPVPDENSLLSGSRAVEYVTGLQPRDLLFCLVSGGGSALMAAPVPGVSLEDLQVLTAELLASGASIQEVNCLRRHLDRLKGAGLVRLANGATVVSLILSDVVGDPLEAIASGPTAPDRSTKTEAGALIDRYNLRAKVPPDLLAGLAAAPETLKPGDTRFEHVQNVIIGSNRLAEEAALTQARLEGLHPHLLQAELRGEARTAASRLAFCLRQARRTGQPVPAPACILAGGETTVTLRGRGRGRGGRNTELALAAVRELADVPDVMLITLASDGEDGPTDAAGAVVTGETFKRAGALGLEVEAYLEKNESYAFFAGLEDLLKPGSTGTNVNDLVFLLVLK